jgi:myo-inositol-1(or 4)-monophosphatase
LEPELSELVVLAQQAGVILRASYEKNVKVNHKSAIDLVTDVDHRSEQFLLRAISERFPGHRVLAEETGAHGDSEAHTWLIDPLDGTVNYAHGIPIFSVSIAYAKNGTIEKGVVYDPMRDECFSAVREEGAWLNGRPLKISGSESLGTSLLVTGFPYDAWENPNNNLDQYAKFAVRTQGVRRLGSAALDLCYVAAGRFDGFWELKLAPWDVAAGALIAAEAGARVTAVDGTPDYMNPYPTILAANAALHAEMLRVLKTEGS